VNLPRGSRLFSKTLTWHGQSWLLFTQWKS